MNKAILLSGALALGFTTTAAASAQTASPSDRDTTVQTSGPNGTSGAVGPNDNTDGSNKDGTRASSTPPTQAAKPVHHHRASKPASAPPPSRG